eukprot:3411582-Pyramimonas_sp.AAC.1
MDAPAAGQGGGAEEQRKRNQRKAWRAKKVLGSESRRLAVCSMAFLAIPLERLQEELTRGDMSSGTKLLLRVFEEKRSNPFYMCRA